ncbi:hypothetical protein L345_08702, partial [Ophiophagus hannah]
MPPSATGAGLIVFLAENMLDHFDTLFFFQKELCRSEFSLENIEMSCTVKSCKALQLVPVTLTYKKTTQFIYSMFTNRKFCVIMGNNISNEKILNNSLLQGFLLALLLFNLCIQQPYTYLPGINHIDLSINMTSISNKPVDLKTHEERSGLQVQKILSEWGQRENEPWRISSFLQKLLKRRQEKRRLAMRSKAVHLLGLMQGGLADRGERTVISTKGEQGKLAKLSLRRGKNLRYVYMPN